MAGAGALVNPLPAGSPVEVSSQMNGLIPLYGADLDLQDWVSAQRAVRLVFLDLAQAIRPRTGGIKRVVFPRQPSHGGPSQSAEYLGRRYSFREHLRDQHLCWRLERLGCGSELWAAFPAVVAGWMAP